MRSLAGLRTSTGQVSLPGPGDRLVLCTERFWPLLDRKAPGSAVSVGPRAACARLREMPCRNGEAGTAAIVLAMEASKAARGELTSGVTGP
jgi:hypothetical protein